jgi:voltage-gated potassium channel
MTRKRVYEIVECARPGDWPSRRFDFLIMSMIVLNIIAFVLETVEPIYNDWHRVFWWIEAVSVAVFTAEYLFRVWSCVENPRFASPILGRLRFAVTPMALVDLLAIVPFYLPMLGADARIVRAFRLFRLFRILKFGRYSRALQMLGNVIKKQREELIIATAVLTLLLLLASTMLYYAEHHAQPEAFPSIPAAMWWAVATLTTVGYGDVYPVTVVGKLCASVTAVLGIGMFALPTGILGAGFVEEIEAARGKSKRCPHCNNELNG